MAVSCTVRRGCDGVDKGYCHDGLARHAQHLTRLVWYGCSFSVLLHQRWYIGNRTSVIYDIGNKRVQVIYTSQGLGYVMTSVVTACCRLKL